jgi:hypothetical protein
MKMFICKVDDYTKYELTDSEILNIKPTIDKNGNAILIVNYYDFEYCINHTIYCERIDVVNDEDKIENNGNSK